MYRTRTDPPCRSRRDRNLGRSGTGRRCTTFPGRFRPPDSRRRTRIRRRRSDSRRPLPRRRRCPSDIPRDIGRSDRSAPRNSRRLPDTPARRRRSTPRRFLPRGSPGPLDKHLPHDIRFRDTSPPLHTADRTRTRRFDSFRSRRFRPDSLRRRDSRRPPSTTETRYTDTLPSRPSPVRSRRSFHTRSSVPRTPRDDRSTPPDNLRPNDNPPYRPRRRLRPRTPVPDRTRLFSGRGPDPCRSPPRTPSCPDNPNSPRNANRPRSVRTPPSRRAPRRRVR